MTARTDRRPVRVTIDGEAYSPAEGVLIVVRQDGGKVCLVEGPGVLVEDVEPPRVWTDGDVIQVRVLSGYWCATRTNDGEWWTTAQAQRPEREHKPWGDDDTVSGIVGRGVATVLRYQSGGDS